MRNKIILAIGALLFIPLAIHAATGGSASATLTLKDVIHITVDGSDWGPLTIDYNSIAGWAAGTIIDWDEGDDDITVKIWALTDFKLWACYYAEEEGDDVDPGFGDPDDLLYLDDSKLYYKKITDPNDYDGTYEGTLTLLYTFTGDNNIKDGGTTLDFEVRLKPENLGDRETDEEITFTIVFIVEEESKI
ncbi:hypothetical protein ACVNPS_02160 [Candidatus Bipolaricaulota sp. J31]